MLCVYMFICIGIWVLNEIMVINTSESTTPLVVVALIYSKRSSSSLITANKM